MLLWVQKNEKNKESSKNNWRVKWHERRGLGWVRSLRVIRRKLRVTRKTRNLRTKMKKTKKTRERRNLQSAITFCFLHQDSLLFGFFYTKYIFFFVFFWYFQLLIYFNHSVLCPSILIKQWSEEIEKNTRPHLSVVILGNPRDIKSCTYQDIFEAG